METETQVKERPILFNGEMVRAVLDGRKTQTRRVIKPQPENMDLFGVRDCNLDYRNQPIQGEIIRRFKSPYGVPGDRLWVRESMAEDPIGSQSHTRYLADNHWRAIDWQYSKPVCPSIHMPRWASRILLEVTDIRVERVQDISDEDAEAEGIRFHSLYGEWGGVEAHPSSRPDCPHWRWYKSPAIAFKNLWNSINEKRGFGWKVNPWVWVVEFKVVQ